MCFKDRIDTKSTKYSTLINIDDNITLRYIEIDRYIGQRYHHPSIYRSNIDRSQNLHIVPHTCQIHFCFSPGRYCYKLMKMSPLNTKSQIIRKSNKRIFCENFLPFKKIVPVVVQICTPFQVEIQNVYQPVNFQISIFFF